MNCPSCGKPVPEDWPKLTHESRAKLFEACQRYVSVDNKWLSEAALETINFLEGFAPRLKLVWDDVPPYARNDSEPIS